MGLRKASSTDRMNPPTKGWEARREAAALILVTLILSFAEERAL